jgi:CHAT domain-containing protein
VSDFPAKAVTAELLLARLDFRAGALLTALNRCTSAGAAVPATGSPSLEYQVAQLRAEILEAMMRRAEAREAYETARQLLERLRFRLRGDEIKVAFLKNKLSVYESLFWLTLTDRSQPDRVARAFAVAETAKSRSMAEQVQASANASAGSSEVLEIRRELDAVYQRIQRVEADAGTSLDIARQQRATLRNRSRRLETQLAGRLAALEGLSGGQALPLNGNDPGALRAWLPEGVQVVEYFVSRDTVFAFLLDRGTLRVWPLAPVQRVQRLARFLRLQLRGSRTALHAHLRSMYDELLEPLRSSLTGDHLVIIPHGALHSIPFAALHDGTSYLLDRYAISYAPSADLLRITTERPASSGSQSLVVGVADAQAPLIEREARTLAGILPNAKLLLGPEASFARLREEAKNSRIVHLAAHGFVQRENPLFSAIRLANSWLTVFDLYRCSIPAELVTLSGCSTGLNEVVGGDELVGLLRGLLQAGARNALVSLWDVDDGSTTQFMESFYRGMLLDGLSPTDALRTASLDLRKTYEDPYHWAAFHLVGLGKKL